MATRRTTFSKTQRERDKRAKAEAKRERRASNRAEQPAEAASGTDENRVIAELAELHERYDNGEISLDDFVARRDELIARLVIT